MRAKQLCDKQCPRCGAVIESVPPNTKYCSLDCAFDDRIHTEGDGCHLWQGPVSPQGYGAMRFKAKLHLVHRFSYERKTGRKIPDGMMICHVCDVPLCCNPAHLFLGTPKDNYDDMVAKGRAPHQRRRSDTK